MYNMNAYVPNNTGEHYLETYDSEFGLGTRARINIPEGTVIAHYGGFLYTNATAPDGDYRVYSMMCGPFLQMDPSPPDNGAVIHPLFQNCMMLYVNEPGMNDPRSNCQFLEEDVELVNGNVLTVPTLVSLWNIAAGTVVTACYGLFYARDYPTRCPSTTPNFKNRRAVTHQKGSTLAVKRFRSVRQI